MKNFAKTMLKIGLSVGLLYWLTANGKLNASSLYECTRDYRLVLVNVVFWILGPAMLCSLRWHQLLTGMGYLISRFDTFRLNLIGLFFNAIMPGAVGGDIMKAVYVCRGKVRSSKIEVLLTLLLDRVVGLLALFFVCLVCLAFNANTIMNDPNLSWVAGFVILSFCGMLAILALGMFPEIAKKFPLAGYFLDLLLRLKPVASLYSAMAKYRNQPKYLLGAFVIGVAHQSLGIALYSTVTTILAKESFSLASLLTILPLAISITALPLSPGGLGVGHLGFERLYSMIGISDGANIFNLIFVFQLGMNLTGSIAYVFSQFSGEMIRPQEELDETPILQRP